MIARELNTAVKAHLVGLGYDLPFRPFYADTSDGGLFVVYYEYPSTKSDEQFFLQKSVIRYMVMGTDVSEVMNVSNHLLDYLNVGDQVAAIKADLSYTDPHYRLDSIRLYNGNNIPPDQKEGYSTIVNDFMAVYVRS